MEEEKYRPSIYDRLYVLTQELTPKLLDVYVKDASPQASGQLGYLYEIYYKIRQFDARIGSAIDKRIDNIVQLDWQISGDDQLDGVGTECLNSLQFGQFVEDLMDGKFMGAAVFQVTWAQKGGLLFPQHPWQLPYSRLYMGSRKDKEDFGKIFVNEGRVLGNIDGTVIDKLQEEHPYMFVCAYGRKKDGFYDVSGILKSILHLYIIKHYALVFWMQYAEKYGEPYMIGSLPENQYKEYRRKMEQALKNVGRDRYLVKIDEMGVDSLTTDGNPQVYKDLIDYADETATIKILGNNLTSKVDGGSYSAALVHDAGEKRKLISDCTWTAEIINDQILKPFYMINFPNLAEEDYPVFEWNLPTSPEEQLSQIRKLGELKRHVPVPKDEFYRQSGVRPPEEGEETVEGTVELSLGA